MKFIFFVLCLVCFCESNGQAVTLLEKHSKFVGEFTSLVEEISSLKQTMNREFEARSLQPIPGFSTDITSALAQLSNLSAIPSATAEQLRSDPKEVLPVYLKALTDIGNIATQMLTKIYEFKLKAVWILPAVDLRDLEAVLDANRETIGRLNTELASNVTSAMSDALSKKATDENIEFILVICPILRHLLANVAIEYTDLIRMYTALYSPQQ